MTLPPVAKQVRLFWAHHISDSEVAHLRYLFRILDRDAKGFINQDDISRELPDDNFSLGTISIGDRELGFEEFIAIGLGEEFLDESHLSKLFSMISTTKTLSWRSFVQSLFENASTQSSVLEKSICSRPIVIDSRHMTLDDFIRCVDRKLDAN
jgi:hypothetical protein